MLHTVTGTMGYLQELKLNSSTTIRLELLDLKKIKVKTKSTKYENTWLL